MQNAEPIRAAFSIFRPILFEAPLPACKDGSGHPVTFTTELEAQREIADNQITRLQEFLDGQRDFEDAITTDEFVLPVKIMSDGSILIEDDRTDGNSD